MPFESESQRRYMWANHPTLAKKWSKEYPDQKNLPYKKTEDKKCDKSCGSEKKANETVDNIGLHLADMSAKNPGQFSMLGGALGAGLGGLAGAGLGAVVPNKNKKRNALLGGALGALAGGGMGYAASPYAGQYLQDTVKAKGEEMLKKVSTPTPSATAAPAAPEPPPRPGSFDLQKLTNNFGGLLPPPTTPKAVPPLKKEGRAKGFDTYGSFDTALKNVSHHPSTITGSMIVPFKHWYEADGGHYESHMDKAKKNREKMTTKEAFKAGVLMRCAEHDMGLPEIEKHLDGMLEKSALGLLESLAAFTGRHGLKTLFSAPGVLGSLAGAGAGLAIGTPIIAGGTTGYLMGKNKKGPDPNEIQSQEMISEYGRLADEAKRRATWRKVQSDSPGSVVKIS